MPRRLSRRLLLQLAAAAPALASPAEWAPRHLLSWGQRGKDPGQFDPPIGIAIDRSDRLYVTDFRNHRVQQFDASGKLLAVWPVAPFPGGIAVAADGTVFVAHFRVQPGQQDRITVLGPDGKQLREWGSTGSAAGQLNQPGGLAVGPDGTVYVADETNHRIQRFTPEGKLLSLWGAHGSGPGQFGGNDRPGNRTGGPQMVAVAPDGCVFTTEGSVCRIQKFTADGKWLWQWVNEGSGPGGFGGRPRNLPGPIGICADRDGNLWITATNNRVQHFTPRGRYLRGFGKAGEGPGEFHTPHGVVVDSSGALYVVDAQNCRIQKFRV